MPYQLEGQSDRTSWIYLLIDPIDDEVRYVGLSVEPQKRFREHCNGDSNKGKTEWIRNLKSQNLLPEQLIIDKSTVKKAGNIERALIARFREMGCELFNLDEGGYHPNLYDEIRNQSRRDKMIWNWENGINVPEVVPLEIQAIRDEKKSKALTNRQMATEEEYEERGEKISGTIDDQWKAGHYDYRAKTGPKSDKEGRIYPEDHQDIIDLYEAGHGVKEIATYYDVHHKSISLVIDKYGVRKERIDHTEEIIRLYTEEMLSIEKIAERIEGISTTVVKNRLKENSIPLRNKTSYSKMTPEMVMDAIERQKNGEKITDMAEEFGVKRSALQQRISTMKKKMGL